MFLIFDTETTGLPRNYAAPLSDSDNWPRMVQLAWQLHDVHGKLIEVKNYIVKPEGFTIPYNAEQIHGISTDRALNEGFDLKFVLEEFEKAVAQSKFVVGHNIEFDINIVGAENIRAQHNGKLLEIKAVDTKDESTNYCALPGGRGGQFKWPTLSELHSKLFGKVFDVAHNAAADVEATARCFLELLRIGVIRAERLGFNPDFTDTFKEHNPKMIEAIGLNVQSYHEEKESVADIKDIIGEETVAVDSIETPFVHLHVHSQFSVLQATTKIKSLIAKAKGLNMPAVALTDHGNMFGAFQFVKEALANEIKPIVGCEYYVTQDRSIQKFTKDNPDKRHTQVFLAKHKQGYHNLAKLSSIGYTEGYYAGFPRIDKEIIPKYKEGLIALTGGPQGEIPDLLLNVGETQAEEAFQWWHNLFGDDFYVELLRHGLGEEEHVNKILMTFAKKYGVKVIAANNVYYLDKEDANAHDILLCVKDGELQSTPIGRGRGFRYGFPNDEFFFKSQKEMKELFADIPEAIENIQEVVDKIEAYKLERDVLLPVYEIPSEFADQDEYLKHLAYEGAKKRYPEITSEIQERLDFELSVIKNTGYPGYFLIVQDFTAQARKMGVAVGPGRGSAAGSAVAYCTGITNVDPIKYNLLFERFLNPDRVSLPDIDIDFDDEGRSKIIDWVVNKYGKNQVAQIITYGSMAAKSAIRDTARVLDLPLFEADRLAKMIPDISLAKLFGLDDKALAQKLNKDQLMQADELKKIAKGTDVAGQTISKAKVLEGSLRNTGTHACGVIITPTDITDHVPVSVARDSDLYVTQYDNSVVEAAGMLKMDFLGLKTLTIIKDAIVLIKERHGVAIDPDTIPLDDAKTYGLYQRGETNGTFQFESPGMQKHLKALVPDKFEDLIAMNALYRPGPMEYIPNFIARKHGREKIVYDIPAMEENLAETYGITVYQEQVMLLSQKLAGFSKGDADVLRKAMGKKIFALLEKLKPKFLAGCKANGHDVTVAEKVWKDWEAFAAYAFNKSHSTCYSVVAFHTGYLKANYPAEYMAAVLTHNMSDIKKVTFFMEECQRMGMDVLGPDVNESGYMFKVNAQGSIRFGLGAVKGVGEAAVKVIIAEREEKGRYSNVFDLTKRIDLRAANKKSLECLAQAGAFDSFEGTHRAQYFFRENEGQTFLESAIRFGSKFQENENSQQQSLFGEASEEIMPEPAMPVCEPWSKLEQIYKEKEVVGVFISGHPLDDYRFELENFCTHEISALSDLSKLKNKGIKVGGMVTEASHRTSKTGNPFGLFTLEDYSGSFQFALFAEDYLKMKHFLANGSFLFLTGKVQDRKWKEGELEAKVGSIQLLSEVRQKLAKELTISFQLDKLSDEFLEELQTLIESHPGDCQLKFSVIDPSEKLLVKMPSRKWKVGITNELIKTIKESPELEYSVNQ